MSPKTTRAQRSTGGKQSEIPTLPMDKINKQTSVDRGANRQQSPIKVESQLDVTSVSKSTLSKNPTINKF